MKILIVDDSGTMRSILRMILEEAGYEKPLVASCASEAFSLLGIRDAVDDVPEIDLVLLDILMPEMNGIEACHVIKESESCGDIPVIMVTSLDDSEHLEAAFRAGAMDYLTKPVDRPALLARVRSALKLKHEMDRRKAHERELEKLLAEKQEAMDRIKVLSGLLPICCSCKKIRDDKGYWQKIEMYIHEHSEANFTHGICPGCMKTLYPEIVKEQTE